MQWYDASAKFPDPGRQRLVLLFAVVAVFIGYFAWWIDFSALRMPAMWIASAAALAAVSMRVAGEILSRRARIEPATVGLSSDPRFAGDNRCFQTLAVAVLIWWILSSYGSGTAVAWTHIWDDPSLRAQGFLAVASILVLSNRNPNAIILARGRRRWILAYGLLGAGMLIMVADTDYQHFVATVQRGGSMQPAVEWDRWIRWRCLNYALIVPYLGCGVAVVNGCRVCPLVLAGISAMVALAVALRMAGIPM